ncbi:unnamed protein product [Pleuronectes platessa]|uniref:Uncharacterized protein n=1 Tax=Pleuronectes platessa TaxID=8262 RepID=A0A9N7Y7Q3_PLEPL|nr:unnamed protein product [Pleuronectes platessa]
MKHISHMFSVGPKWGHVATAPVQRFSIWKSVLEQHVTPQPCFRLDDSSVRKLEAHFLSRCVSGGAMTLLPPARSAQLGSARISSTAPSLWKLRGCRSAGKEVIREL